MGSGWVFLMDSLLPHVAPYNMTRILLLLASILQNPSTAVKVTDSKYGKKHSPGLQLKTLLYRESNNSKQIM